MNFGKELNRKRRSLDKFSYHINYSTASSNNATNTINDTRYSNYNINSSSPALDNSNFGVNVSTTQGTSRYGFNTKINDNSIKNSTNKSTNPNSVGFKNSNISNMNNQKIVDYYNRMFSVNV